MSGVTRLRTQISPIQFMTSHALRKIHAGSMWVVMLLLSRNQWWRVSRAALGMLGAETRLCSSVSSDFCILQAGWCTHGFFDVCRHHPFFHIQGFSSFFHSLKRKGRWKKKNKEKKACLTKLPKFILYSKELQTTVHRDTTDPLPVLAWPTSLECFLLFF